MRHLLACSLLAAASAPAAAQQPPRAAEVMKRYDRDNDGKLDPKELEAFLRDLNRPRLPEGTTAHRDLAYGPHERHKLDLYLPEKADKPLPLVVWVHGGAWLGGSKEGGPALGLLRQGYAVASVNYRLSQHATYPAQIEDCKAAVRYLRANAGKHGLNPDRFGVWGSSAGGHLVALLGTTGDVKEFDAGPYSDVSSRVQAVCDFFGPADFTTIVKQSGPENTIDHDSADCPEAKLIGGRLRDHPDKARRASPAAFVSADDAPFLIFHGDEDALVPVGQSRQLHDGLKKAGVESELVVFEGAGHGGPDFNKPETTRKIEQFFAKHLKK